MKMRHGRGLGFLTAALLSLPAAGQVDFSGEWSPFYHEDGPERLPGPELGDFMGIPLSEAGRLAAESYDSNRISAIQEYQCRPHSSDYSMRGLGNLRVWRDIDSVSQQLIAFRTYMPAWGSDRTIWMDGREHPHELAEYTFQGFSTGEWEGNTLKITTTHLKENYIRRNGIPRSDKAEATEYWTRHRNYLTVVTVVDDPVYLTEPLVRSQNWILDPGQALPQMFCEYTEEVPAEEGEVPHYLPGENPFLTEVAEWYALPVEATLGGAKTIYPEYKLEMPEPPVPRPERCDRFCLCTGLGDCQLHERR